MVIPNSKYPICTIPSLLQNAIAMVYYVILVGLTSGGAAVDQEAAILKPTLESVVVRGRPKSHRQLTDCPINCPIRRHTRTKSIGHHQLFSSFAHRTQLKHPFF